MKAHLRRSSEVPSNSVFTPQQVGLKPRPFTVQAQSAEATPQQQQMSDLETQLKSAERFGHNFANISIFTPGTAPSSPLQRKLTLTQPTDKTEQEADKRLAEGVTQSRTPNSQSSAQNQLIHRQEVLEEKEPLVQLSRERRDAVSSVTPTALNQSIPLEEPASTALSTQATKQNKQPSTKFTDFDAKQYRVSGKAPNRKTEEVKRTEVDGKVTYFAMGLVVDFQSNRPVVEYYPEPLGLGSWYPSVTHINGMAVKPESGIKSAELLQQKVNEALDSAKDDNGVALGQDAVDVLYTYSATLGIFDPLDCIKGKLDSPLKRMKDEATEAQENIMLDAVHNKHRTTVSAHSRGTIKTDNAVGNVYRQLVKEYSNEPELQQTLEAQMKGVPKKLAEKARQEAEKIRTQMAEKRAIEEMNQYIQLIYAGNAVLIPSQVLKGVSFVAHGTKVLSKNKDYVSIFFGKHQLSTKNLKLHQVKPEEMDNPNEIGGHAFDKHYAKIVGKEIAGDIINNRQPEEE